jgi:hypothetical protein
VCGVRDCRLRRGLLFSRLMGGVGAMDSVFGVNKGTDWDSGLAQNTEQLAHAKIAVGASCLRRGCALVLMVDPPFSVVRST